MAENKWVAGIITPYKWSLLNLLIKLVETHFVGFGQEIWVLLLEKAVAKFCGSHGCRGFVVVDQLKWMVSCMSLIGDHQFYNCNIPSGR